MKKYFHFEVKLLVMFFMFFISFNVINLPKMVQGVFFGQQIEQMSENISIDIDNNEIKEKEKELTKTAESYLNINSSNNVKNDVIKDVEKKTYSSFDFIEKMIGGKK